MNKLKFAFYTLALICIIPTLLLFLGTFTILMMCKVEPFRTLGMNFYHNRIPKEDQIKLFKKVEHYARHFTIIVFLMILAYNILK